MSRPASNDEPLAGTRKFNEDAAVVPARSRTMVLKEADRVLSSSCFRAKPSVSKMLRILVENEVAKPARTASGTRRGLTEAEIGARVVGPAFDPSLHSNMRFLVDDLQTTLRSYYAGEGKARPVRIDLRPVRYFGGRSGATSWGVRVREIVPQTATPLSPELGYRQLLEKKLLGEPLSAAQQKLYVQEREALLKGGKSSPKRMRQMVKAMQDSRAKEPRIDELTKLYGA